VRRGNGPKGKLKRHNYRSRALRFLLEDFQCRCAYSLQHVDKIGLSNMEVDHFDPSLSETKRHRYANLFPATRHCNGSKGPNWPNARQLRVGMRFLNCCDEVDYGSHIFEHPKTRRLVGVSPAGRYHIRMCDLNAPHLVTERKLRAELWRHLTARKATIRDLSRLPDLHRLLLTLTALMDQMIPMLQELPTGAAPSGPGP
jgi:hypothetical protein